MQYLKKNRLTLEQYTAGLLSNDTMVLSKAITLVESDLEEDQLLAMELLEAVLPRCGNAIRVGITGVPGVGKSTFIDVLGHYLIQQGHQVAVLAVDPTSEKTRGSILGDKTRMNQLSKDPRAFIRPSAAGTSLGGVAHYTREASLLCEASGYDIILIETMGVGQSETMVHGMVDFFMLLMLSGAGDELQGIKKGIVEMADAILITKADGDNRKNAEHARSVYANAMHLLLQPQQGWKPPVRTCSATANEGISEAWKVVLDYMDQARQTGFLQQKRAQQRLAWMHQCLQNQVERHFRQQAKGLKQYHNIQQQVQDGTLLPAKAAQQLLEDALKRLG